jgi:hypothetical protein
MKAKRASFKSRHAKNIAKGPSSPAYWANKVKWADGGSVKLNYAEGDSVRTQPQQPVLGSIANFLKQSYAPQRTQQMQGVMEFLGVPAVARTVERMSYGQPITNINKANVPLLPEDTAEAAMLVGPMAGPLTRVAGKAGKAGARVVGEELNRAILDNSGPLARAVPQAVRPLNVVKPKGGNWIAGSIEEGLKPLKRPVDTTTSLGPILERYGLTREQLLETPLPERLRMYDEVLDPGKKNDLAVNKWVDTKLSKYIKNEMATPEDSLRRQADDFATEKAEMLAVKDAQLAKARADMEAARQARGFTPEMMTSSQARIRELENERGLIAERTGLHVVPEPFGPLTREDVWNIREMEGFPGQGMGTSDVARRWETAADMEAGLDTASAYKHALEQNPWLAKVDPNSPVYDFGSRGSRNMGFDHMADELRNALDPASGLPEKLLIKLEDLDKMTVPRAAKLVDEINAWRAMQQVEANAARAGNAATQVFKEYPEQGMKWVELAQPKITAESLPPGYEMQTFKNNNGGTYYSLRDMNDGGVEVGAGMSPELAIESAAKKIEDPRLEEALKYEGETMGHCVGGYCPDVIEGRSRIFSLRDQKGQPYATVETKPNRIQDFTARTLDPDNPAQTLRDRINAERAGNGDFESYGTSLLQRLGIEPPMDIVQIKGPKNKAPDAKYLPMIQDFVKSGNWNKVDDLQNTGFAANIKPGTKINLFGNEGLEVPGYMTEPEFVDFVRKGFADKVDSESVEGYLKGYQGERYAPPDTDASGYAEGGSVSAYDPFQVDEVMNSINAPRGYAAGGSVSAYDSSRVDAILNEFM